MPIIPGIMPVTSLTRLTKLCELAGLEVPRELAHRLETASDPRELHRIGVEHALDQCRKVLDAGAPGLHFFTFNEHEAVLDVLEETRRSALLEPFQTPLSDLQYL